MNIKKIVKSQKLRHRLMRLGAFLPDRVMLPLQYKILLKRWPNLQNPKRFTEWIQYYKMNYRNPVMLECVDKYSVRDFVGGIIGEENLVKLYACCERAEDIDFTSLPDKFVIKSTSGGNGDNVLIVKDKKGFDIDKVIPCINKWLEKNYSDTSREWAYKKAAEKPRIIIEELIEDKDGCGLDDYKFFCFNGVCKFFKIDFDRYVYHKANYYSPDGTPLASVREVPFESDFSHAPVDGEDLKQMIEKSEILSSGFPFVRVDFYCVDHKIYFGEMTFYPASGFAPFTPDSFDFEAGSYFPDKSKEIWTRYIHAGK